MARRWRGRPSPDRGRRGKTDRALQLVEAGSQLLEAAKQLFDHCIAFLDRSSQLLDAVVARLRGGGARLCAAVPLNRSMATGRSRDGTHAPECLALRGA